MTYRDIFIGSNTRDASDLDATADLSLMNNTTANSLSIASNGKLYLGGNPNQRAVQLVLTGNNGGVAATLASGASLDLTVNTETLTNSADNAWAALKAETAPSASTERIHPLTSTFTAWAPPETGPSCRNSPLTPSMRKTDWSRRTGKPGRRTW